MLFAYRLFYNYRLILVIDWLIDILFWVINPMRMLAEKNESGTKRTENSSINQHKSFTSLAPWRSIFLHLGSQVQNAPHQHGSLSVLSHAYRRPPHPSPYLRWRRPPGNITSCCRVGEVRAAASCFDLHARGTAAPA